MGFFLHVIEAISNLLAAKVRSFLAILGVLVGTGSVVALISSSQLATEHALSQFKSLGTNLLAVMINSEGEGGLGGGGGGQKKNQAKELEFSDIELIQENVPEIQLIAPYTSLFQPLYFQDINFSGQILGATLALADIAKINLASGRMVSVLDRNTFFCVVGYSVANKIKRKGFNPIGQQIKVGNNLFTIIGTTEKWKPNLFLFNDINQGIIIPLELSFLISPTAKIHNLLIRLHPEANLAVAKDKIQTVIKKIAPTLTLRFQDPQQIIDIVGNERKTFSWLLSAIGGISLIVGGIGVMNIMLVSVIERRREIGIRMAVGAKRKDILTMFLIESVILTGFGGILGIMVGTIISFALALITHWEYHFYFIPPLLGFFVSVMVGILSGIYPSYRASRLDPIKTLQGD